MELILPSDVTDHSVPPASLPPGQTTGYGQDGGDLLSYHCETSVRVSAGKDQLVRRVEPISFTLPSSPSFFCLWQNIWEAPRGDPSFCSPAQFCNWSANLFFPPELINHVPLMGLHRWERGSPCHGMAQRGQSVHCTAGSVWLHLNQYCYLHFRDVEGEKEQ